MNEFELWLCVISGESDNERLLYRGDDRMEVDRIINECDDEVTTDPDKYFLLNDMTFYSYRDYAERRPHYED